MSIAWSHPVVEIIKTNTTTDVQAMLVVGKMDIATGVAAAPFVTPN
jgi:hypothetical protein